jgi:ribonuclease D
MQDTDPESPLIADQETLAVLAQDLAAADAVAIDTEFVRERTYFPKLCLLQVATEDRVACIDCLADMDLAPIFASLFRDDCEWVLHSARQDLEIFWNLSERMPAKLFDTQLAAGLLGFAPQIGLQDLVAQELSVQLDKTLTRTDWTRRPLPPAALDYALDDVRYLLALARQLREELIAQDRYEWYQEDIARQLADPPVSDAVSIWQRLKGTGKMSQTEQAAALSLVRWRENEAQRMDRPRRWILSDEVLARIARTQPSDRDALAGIAEMPSRLATRSGAEILDAVTESATRQLMDTVTAATLPQPDKSELQALQAEVRQRASELDIHTEVLATRRDLVALVTGAAPTSLQAGWRARALRRES